MKAEQIKKQREKNIGDGINKKKVEEMEKSRKRVRAEMEKRRK